MKYILSENKMVGVLQSYLDKRHHDWICEYIVKSDEDIHMIISRDVYEKNSPYFSAMKIKVIEIRLKNEIKNFFGLDVKIISHVEYCE
jgi:hypothetical protein